MATATRTAAIRVGQKLGKYRIDRRIAAGGFATVYRAYDTIAGIPVALKIPPPGTVTKRTLEDFRKEVRVHAKLDHPNILPIKDAGFIDDVFVIAYPLGRGTLADRLKRRMSIRTIVELADQMLAAVAHAHSQRVMHLDVKPENFILFDKQVLRLTDFGIAKVAQRTLEASGSGTVGYIAPEQALGRPSFRSDVFSLGLLLYRMFSGRLPRWPFDWPPPGFERVRRNLHADLVAFLRRAMEVDHRKRFADAGQMQAAFRRLRPRALKSRVARRRARREPIQHTWRAVRHNEFVKQYRGILEIGGQCHHCEGPVSESMHVCPWCGTQRKIAPDEHRFRTRCPRCKRSIKTDWRFCPWCHGKALNPDAAPRYSDNRYTARCRNRACPGKSLMPFMRYCPWCRRKVQRTWKIPGSQARCKRCGWGVLLDYWDYCPWCGRTIHH